MTLLVLNSSSGDIGIRVRLENDEHVLEIISPHASGVYLTKGARAELDLPETGSPTLLEIRSGDEIVFGNNNDDDL